MMRKLLSLLIILCCCINQAYADPNKKLTLSLTDAILLAVRTNPNVQNSQLNDVLQKYALFIQHWNFYPHYSLTASATTSRTGIPGQFSTGENNLNLQPSITEVTPFGTSITLNSNNTKTSHYNPQIALDIVQPLMRGFGRPIVEAALKNAEDSEVISQLNIEGTLRSTVSSVIDSYLEVVSAERMIGIDEKAVERATQSVEQTKIFIKAGHKAGNELVTVQANVASAKTTLENAKNNLLQARYALLTAIGMDPNTDVAFTNLDVKNLIAKYHLPTLEDTKSLVLRNDIQYQSHQITLYGATKRSVMTAEDNARWLLNVNAHLSTGGGSGGGQNAGFNSLINGVNQGQSVGLTLTIPIDDQIAKQSILSAKIALKEAELGLKQEKWSRETSAINSWNSVGSAERALHFAEDAAKLQQTTYNVSYQKYLHGLIDSLELQTAQMNLIQSQQTLLSAQINYLKSLVTLDLLTGNTLYTWNVKVRL